MDPGRRARRDGTGRSIARTGLGAALAGLVVLSACRGTPAPPPPPDPAPTVLQDDHGPEIAAAPAWLEPDPGEVPLVVPDPPRSLRPGYATRLAVDGLGAVWVTDPLAGGVYIYDPELAPRRLLTSSPQPLGIAVGPDGRVRVGDDARDGLDVYGPDGTLLGSFAQGEIEMPTALDVSSTGEVFVADATRGAVVVYDEHGDEVRRVDGHGGECGPLGFLADVALSPDEQELFVADQRGKRVVVFDLQGAWLRTLGGPAEDDEPWEGRLLRPQSLAFDTSGALLVADTYLNRVVSLDPQDGTYLGHLDGPRTDAGEARLMLDLAVLSDGRVLATSPDKGGLEVLRAAD